MNQTQSKMILYNQKHATERINNLARENKDFIFIINYDGTKAYVEELKDISPQEMLFSFPAINNIPHGEPFSTAEVKWTSEVPAWHDYEEKINYVKQKECEGDSYLANLTCKVPIQTNLSLHDIFMRSKALYRCWIKELFVCFSPEIFVRINNKGRISSYPMKGTIDATLPEAEKQLMENMKEAAEHATIVDLIRNDLSRIAHHVHVERYRYIDRLTTNKGQILQTSSEIVGQLPTNYASSLGNHLFQLLPAGSITGAPKPRTMEIIHAAEQYERGFYTGVMGCYTNGCLDSAVMIRFIDQEKDGQLYYKAGGGITAQSDNKSEYKEVIEKIYVPIY